LYGHLSVVEYLVYQNADINAKNNDGKTPLGLAEKSDIVEFLERNEEEQRLREEEKRRQKDCRI